MLIEKKAQIAEQDLGKEQLTLCCNILPSCAILPEEGWLWYSVKEPPLGLRKTILLQKRISSAEKRKRKVGAASVARFVVLFASFPLLGKGSRNGEIESCLLSVGIN